MRFATKFLACAATAGLLAAAAPALAQTPSQESEIAGATTGLGSSHRFPTQDAAAAHCPGDTIVWGSRTQLTYTLPNTPNYGTGNGFYACKMEADSAGFTPK